MSNPELKLIEQVKVTELENYIARINQEGCYVTRGWQNPAYLSKMFVEVVFVRPEKEFKFLKKGKIYEMSQETPV